MSNVQRVTVTRQTTIEVSSEGDQPKLIDVESLGRRTIESTATPALAEIEAVREVAPESEELPTGELKSIQDVEIYVQDTISAEVDESLEHVGITADPWSLAEAPELGFDESSNDAEGFKDLHAEAMLK